MKRILSIVLMLFAFAVPAYSAVNINTATQAQLETLHGIGPTKAKAIVEHRKKKGAFKSVDDLQKVNGIGPATIKRLRKDVAVSGPTTIAKKVESSDKAKSVEKAKPATKTKTSIKGKPATKL